MRKANPYSADERGALRFGMVNTGSQQELIIHSR
jgi:hypothetical protein